MCLIKQHKVYWYLFFSLVLLSAQVSLSQSIFANSSYETGVNANCNCPTGYICANDAGRVVSGFHPNFVVGNQGCIGGQNYFPPFGAHGGSCCVYFYAGADRITTGNAPFLAGEKACVCVWYAGPQGSGASGQNTANSYFRIGVDGVGVSPNILVPVNTTWTQYCFITAALTAGNHNFSIMSGGAAQYSIWNDDFTVNVCTVLPIELTSFDAHYKDNVVVLNWITASETNNEYFTIEKSNNGYEFVELIKIPGAGNSNKTLHYSAYDIFPAKGISYYRLKQTDKSGNSTTSHLVYVNSDSGINLVVYPNPSNGTFSIDIDDDISNTEAVLINSVGEIIHKQKVSKGNNEINLTEHTKGIYNIILFNENQKVYNSKIRID